MKRYIYLHLKRQEITILVKEEIKLIHKEGVIIMEVMKAVKGIQERRCFISCNATGAVVCMIL